MDGPLPELLAAYGTDEVYFRNLEKRAADTIFGAPTARLSRGGFGRLLVGGRDQRRVDRFRADAEALNQRFRSLETEIMSNSVENLGGPGTQRSAFTRALMTQPYSVHPLLYAQATGGPGGVMPPPAELAQMPSADDGMERTAAVAVARRIGVKLAQGMGSYPVPQAYALRPPPLTTEPSITQDLESGGAELGRGAVRLGRGLGRGAGKAMAGTGGLFQRLGRGLQDFMSSERQPTPRWGTGFAPAKDVNEYGVPVY